MGATSPMAQKPNKQDVDEGTFALCLSGTEYELYQFDTKSPLRTHPDWRHVDTFHQESAPPLNLESAIFTDEDGETWAYAKNLEPEYQLEEDSDEISDKTKNNKSGKYAILIGNEYTASGNTQSEVMAETVELLIEKYNLLDKIDLPYMSGHKNALLNHRGKHPDGREMRSSRKVKRGIYVSTDMDSTQKKSHIKELANVCEVSAEFVRDF